MGDSLIAGALLLHGLVAVALLGAITHQAMAVGYGSAADTRSFTARYRSVDAAAYAGVIILLFTVATLMGASLYPAYRLIVRPVLQQGNLRMANGAFEIKEQLAALGLLMLPAYWAVWKKPLLAEHAAARKGLTWVLTAIVWWNFLIGGVLTNIKGLFH